MIKIKIHPLFVLYTIILVIQNQFIYLLSSLVCIAIHELSHARMAYYRGYYLDTVNLMPYGAMLSGKDEFNGKDGFLIAVAGPLSNIILCICLLASWWIFPTVYSYTKIIFDASIALAFFNLLPIFPLDGARILLSVAKHPQKTIVALKVIGVIISGLFAIAFFVSIFYSTNLNLGIMSAVLYVSTNNASEKEAYKQICNNCLYIKRIDVPIKKITLIIHQDIKIIRLLKHVSAESETTFEIVNDDLKKIKTLSENELKAIATTANLHTPIKEFLYP